jgi:hypothetical protein
MKVGVVFAEAAARRLTVVDNRKCYSRILSVIGMFHQVREAFAYASSIFATATIAL